MKPLTKHNVAVACARRHPDRISASTAALVVDSAIEAIIAYFESGGTSLTLRGFGSFRTSTRRAFTTRNPHDGSRLAIPSARALVFKQSREIIARLNP